MTPHEIRTLSRSRYDFTKPLALDDVTADVEADDADVAGAGHASALFRAVQPERDAGVGRRRHAGRHVQPAAGGVAHLAGGERNRASHPAHGWRASSACPPTTSASFTSGGAEANLSAVVVALTRAFPEYGDGGLREHLPATPAIYLTREAHDSFNKIAHMTGIGRGALRTVATDRRSQDGSGGSRATGRRGSPQRARAADGGRHRRHDRRGRDRSAARIWRGSAGRSELWFHVDAAWGGAAILSPRLRGHLAGIDAADSITCDAHKWFSVPMGAGMFFCRHPDVVGEAFRAQTAYMPPEIRRAGRRSVHDLGSMVAAVHRLEAVSRARASAANPGTSR